MARTISSGPSTPNCIRCTRLCGAELYVKRSMAPVLRLLRPGCGPVLHGCDALPRFERAEAMSFLRRGTWGLCTRAARAALSGRAGAGRHAWADTPAHSGWGTGQGFRSGGAAGHTWGVRGFASDGGTGDGGDEPPVAEEPAAEDGEEHEAGARRSRVLACASPCVPPSADLVAATRLT